MHLSVLVGVVRLMRMLRIRRASSPLSVDSHRSLFDGSLNHLTSRSRSFEFESLFHKKTERRYAPLCFGRSSETRTHGLCVPNAARYQLRHTPPTNNIVPQISKKGST